MAVAEVGCDIELVFKPPCSRCCLGISSQLSANVRLPQETYALSLRFGSGNLASPADHVAKHQHAASRSHQRLDHALPVSFQIFMGSRRLRLTFG